MPAKQYDITIEVGSDFNAVLTWKDNTGALVNLTGYTAKMQIKSSYQPSATLIASYTNTDAISLGGAAGTITIAIPGAESAAYTIKEGVYDLKLTSGAGAITRLLQGRIFLSPAVTV